MNRVKINAIATKTPKVLTKLSMKRNGITHSNRVTAIPDTGAEMTVAGKDLLEKLGLTRRDIRSPNTTRLYAANDTEIRVIGTINAEIEYAG